jgi:pyrroloquinoline quinone biosynthesis protein B
MLHRVPNQLSWIDIAPNKTFSLPGGAGDSIACTPIPLSGNLPFYAQDSRLEVSGEASIGLILECAGQRLAYFPSLPEMTPKLKAVFESCDTILIDGTFWSDNELRKTHPGTPLAREIGHIPLSGEDGTIAQLASLKEPQKVLIHINNTNPILDPSSLEHKLVADSGWQIANDGWEWKPR